MGQQHSGGTRTRGIAWPAIFAAVLIVAGLGLSGCAPSALEQDFGRSVHNNLAQMLVNPQAAQDLTPAVGLDPKAGYNALEKYDKTFKTEEKKTETKMTTGTY
jgi:hypothetical protein